MRIVVGGCLAPDAGEVAHNERLEGWDAGTDDGNVRFDCGPD